MNNKHSDNFDPYIDKHVVSAALGIKPSTAANLISKINNDIKKEGYLTVAGRIPASELCNRYKINLETIVWFYHNLNKSIDIK